MPSLSDSPKMSSGTIGTSAGTQNSGINLKNGGVNLKTNQKRVGLNGGVMPGTKFNKNFTGRDGEYRLDMSHWPDNTPEKFTNSRLNDEIVEKYFWQERNGSWQFDMRGARGVDDEKLGYVLRY